MGIVEMRACRNEDAIDIAAWERRPFLVESTLADAEIDRQKNAAGLGANHGVVKGVGGQHPVVHERERGPSFAFVFGAPEDHL